MNVSEKKFLTTEWRKLIFFNYEIDPAILKPLIPKGTELDLYGNICYISLVGFQFLKTKALGIPIPFHQDFEEINLRFYVKRKCGEEWRRAVVFVKEIVSKPAVTFVAKKLYHEPYVTMPMKYDIRKNGKDLDVSYCFFFRERWNKMSVRAIDKPADLKAGSADEFITQHFWGYNRYSSTITTEYEVEHPAWKIYPVRDYTMDIDYHELYGSAFRETLGRKPVSVILAEGSEVIVRRGVHLKLN